MSSVRKEGEASSRQRFTTLPFGGVEFKATTFFNSRESQEKDCERWLFIYININLLSFII